MKRFVTAHQKADDDKTGIASGRASASAHARTSALIDETEVKSESKMKPRASFSTFTGLFSPGGRRRTFTSQGLSANAQTIKDMLSLASLKSYGELDDASARLDSGLSDDGSDSENERAATRPKMLSQPSGMIKPQALDDSDVTESTDLSERSLHESSTHSLPASSPNVPRRRMSAGPPSSPFVIRKDKEGSTTKWVAADSISAPYLELNIQPSNKRSSNRNRRRRSTRSAPSGSTAREKQKTTSTS